MSYYPPNPTRNATFTHFLPPFATNVLPQSRMAELMFEKFQTPALFISKDAVLECYAVGRTTGLVIDVGASGTVLAPVCDGWVDSRGLNRSIIGGRCMDSQALAMLKKRLGGANPVPLFRLNKSFHQDRGLSVKMKDKIGAVHPTYDALMVLEIGRDLKESSCRIADSQFQDGDVRYASMPSQPYELPDGTIIELGKERFQIPELLFDSSPLVKFAPELLLLNLGSSAFFSSDEERTPNIAQDSEATISSTVATSSNGSTLSPSLASPESIQRLAVNTVVRCDTDNHQPLLSNIVIAGGGSCFEGMPERIKVEIEKLVHASAPGFKVRQLSTNVTERALCAWIGGSILASLGSFHEYWLTKKEYEENGATVVDRKCP